MSMSRFFLDSHLDGFFQAMKKDVAEKLRRCCQEVSGGSWRWTVSPRSVGFIAVHCGFYMFLSSSKHSEVVIYI